ncbi:MAG: NYN domain-containing protein [Coriobacteriia bacterium]|nr:NYN domain-containing protein [Coriobacteriia bacterium]MBN2822947.1 NYN domain-containing protein [Coriobacteriia bacterium]
MTRIHRLIVDGYNVMHGSLRYRSAMESDLDAARSRLVEDVASFAVGESRAVVVFDGGGNPVSDGTPHHVAGVTIIFSPSGYTADSVVEGLARRSRERGERVTVVTSDAATQWTVFAGEVSRMSAAEFSRRLSETGDDWLGHSPTGSVKGRVQDRIGDDVRDTLSRWARGEPPRL